MSVIYQSQFTVVGHLAREGFEDGLFITFSEHEIVEDMVEYCFVHKHGELAQDFTVGDVFIFDNKRFSVTAVGNNAIDNFRALGHITVYFDGAAEAKLPGAVHLLGQLPEETLDAGCQFLIESY